VTGDRWPYIRGDAPDLEDLSPAARAVVNRHRDKWAQHPPTRHALTIRDQWNDFDATDAAREAEQEGYR
jgi:hypothetical protein